MKLSESISQLIDTFNSIDIRVATYNKDDLWHTALLVIRFRKESVDQVEDQQAELIKKYGEIKENNFQVRLYSLETSYWKSIIDNWRNKSIQFPDNFTLNLNRRNFYS